MCPPGVDQTTRSLQQWHILAPLIREQHDITNLSTGGALFGASLGSWDAFSKLAIRTFTDMSDVEAVLSELPPPGGSRRASPFESLPNELLAMIFNDEALNRSNILAIGLCSNILWRNCLSHIQAAHSRPPWSETPLICTGTHLTDLPPKILEIEPSLKIAEDAWQARPHGPGLPRLGMPPARSWNWNMISTSRKTNEDDPNVWMNDFDAVAYNEKNSIPLSEKKVLRLSLGHLLSANKPKPGSQWLLRNHDTRECARIMSASKNAMEPHFHVEGLPWLSPDKALVMRICWTTISQYRNYSAAEKKVMQGPWAGHCFDIVRADSGERGTGSSGSWTDVTGEIVRDAKIWKTELSPEEGM